MTIPSDVVEDWVKVRGIIVQFIKDLVRAEFGESIAAALKEELVERNAEALLARLANAGLVIQPADV